MILDDKIIMFPPPPPYLQYPSSPSVQFMHHPHGHHTNTKATLTSLPPHILLQIIHHTFPPLTQSQSQLYQDTMPEKQRKTLFWLSTSLRLVSRQLYTACMHVLRSTYLPSYQSLIRAPYTSDPFPLSLPASSMPSSQTQNQSQTTIQPPSSPTLSTTTTLGPPAYSRSTTSLTSLPPQPLSPLLTIHRETPILDRFIALKVRQDVFADDTELHTDREDAFRDLFDVAQPRARLEDLVRVYGVREGVVSVPGSGWVASPSPSSLPSPSPSLPPTSVSMDSEARARMYANPTVTRSSSSFGSIPASPLPIPLTPTTSIGSGGGGGGGKSAYTYTLDPSLNPTPVPPSSSSSSSAIRGAPPGGAAGNPNPKPTATIPPTPTPTQKTAPPRARRSFFSLSLGFSKSSSSSPSPTSSPSPSPSQKPSQQPPAPPQPTQPKKPRITPIPFTSLSISFSPRRVGLLLNRSRTIAAVPRHVGVGRARGEPLEVLARALVEELKVVLAE